MSEHRGTLILVLGIVSLIVCQFLGIVPWMMGNADLKAMDAGTMDPEGRGMTEAGKILGIISIVIAALCVLGVIVFLMIFVLAAAGASAQ